MKQKRILVIRGVAQFGRALPSGGRGRRFKSSHLDWYFLEVKLLYNCYEDEYLKGTSTFLSHLSGNMFRMLTHCLTSKILILARL